MSLNPRPALQRLLRFKSIPARASHHTQSAVPTWRPVALSCCSCNSKQQISRSTPRRRLLHTTPDTTQNDPISSDIAPGSIHEKTPEQPEPEQTPELNLDPSFDPTVLPYSCPGCGAFTQWVSPEEAGFYSLRRKPVKDYIRRTSAQRKEEGSAEESKAEDDGAEKADKPVEDKLAEEPAAEEVRIEDKEVESKDAPVETKPVEEPTAGEVQMEDKVSENTNAPAELSENPMADEVQVEGMDPENTDVPAQAKQAEVPAAKSKGTGHLDSIVAVSQTKNISIDVPSEEIKVPLCDRCHNLINHNHASPIPYPPISYIEDIIAESPYRHNHVYHVIDAADFPMSLIPNISRILDLQKLRSKNRRARTIEYSSSGRKPVVSFIITRSDLLGSQKEFVDHMMPYFLNVMREKLGKKGDKLRLGNVHLVSAHRGWWTKEIKDKIWEEGGGVWMVGKTNVGKSSLMSVVFPKTPVSLPPSKRGNVGKIKEGKHSLLPPPEDLDLELPGSLRDPENMNQVPDEADILLPPVQQVDGYPIFPIVSASPGTTASPIRIPFGKKRGEVIDLPGLSRGGLEEYVKDSHKADLIMKKRLKPERYTLKPRQSLILGGGLVRITPADNNAELVILAAPFITLKPHITSTEKAILMQAQERQVPNVENISNDGIGPSIASAGVFEITADVTKTYGPPADQRKSIASLPYRVLSTDILIEGCGWVELVVQVRARDLEDGIIPKVEVFTPGGKFVSSRMPMCAYSFLLEKRRKAAKAAGRRPARSMKRIKKRAQGGG
ncbi:hypothetical protein FQN51_005096 [Onygenales sp. PD_10]|nr:hypothetical protein FQN51_005096 [Onygenales sp. PD_10]